MSIPAAYLTSFSLVTPNQPFPAYLKDELTRLQSLSMNAISFVPGEFAPLLNSRCLLPGLANVTSLTLRNMPDFPRIILASCVRLENLDIKGVRISDDASRMISVRRPKLTMLVCKDTDEQTFAHLVSVVDVAQLRSLKCDLAWGSTLEGRAGHPIGPQHVLNLCRNSLQYLTLCSRSALQPPNKLESIVICDLAHHNALTHLTFTSGFLPGEHDQLPHTSQKLVLEDVLAKVTSLRRLHWKIFVGLDQALKRTEPDGAPRLDNAKPLPLFQHPAWRRLDRALARVADVHTMDVRVLVNIFGIIDPGTKALYDPQHLFYDGVDMGSLMERWGRHTFVESRKRPRTTITVSAGIGPRGGLTCVVE
ncbi:hypothetical protein HYPSUDRAFT_217512 [Hypholoma sublateritium FD-334 SS-4]|uniref:Uncharacterized protein n=1 Tax=Hypholoma sublateritium (strain FD-334 SS-4) TaxID=945553 RepID=A0A0D2PHK0_HYPSF|nr:hypothetical protein HYPSUDRAFT_217512 [Hypholoma sublateritium FD-334 SS-4]